MRNISVIEIQLLEIVKGNLSGGEGSTVPLNKIECLILHSIKVYFVGMCLKIFKMLIPWCVVMPIFLQWKNPKTTKVTQTTLKPQNLVNCISVQHWILALSCIGIWVWTWNKNPNPTTSLLSHMLSSTGRIMSTFQRQVSRSFWQIHASTM